MVLVEPLQYQEALGEGKKNMLKKFLYSVRGAVLLSVGIIMSALFLIFMDPIIGIIGASAETWDLRKHILQLLYVIQVHSFLLRTGSQIFFVQRDSQVKP